MRYLVLFAIVLASSTASAQPPSYPPTLEGAREEIYKRVGDVELKLWVFDPPGREPEARRPAIIFFFGGGWKSGNPAQFEKHCRYLAQQGMVAVTADYRVRERHQTLAVSSVADAKSAIRWLRQHADRLGIDPDRIVAGGGSAGGHLAACTGVISEFDEPSESPQVSSVPNAMALFNPAVLLSPFEDVTLDDEKLADLETRTGVAPQRLSPIHHLRRGLPPTIIFHGQADTTVPYETVQRFSQLASSLGNRCELVGYRGAPHGFFNHGRDGNPGEYFPVTVHRLHQFLHSLGYIDDPPRIAVPKSANVHLRSHFDHSRREFVSHKRGTVAFIGGSITEMNGYRVMVQQALKQRFPETEFSFINAGISSTCSTTGAFRLDRDVLSANPDLLFIEFAVNDDQDAGHAWQQCTRGMEGILRLARHHNPQLDMVVTHFVNPPMLDLLRNGQTPVSSAAHEAVAGHYGVATIDLAREVAQRIDAGTLTWQQYGGTHPAEAGNQIAADMIADLLDTAWSDEMAEHDPTAPHRMPKAIDALSYSRGRLIDVAAAELDDGWRIERPDWTNIKGSLRARFKDAKLLCSDRAGAAGELRFEGTAVGLYVLAGPDAGQLEYSIDGATTRQVDLYHRFSKGLHYPRTVMLDADLEPRAHELTFRISGTTNRDSLGHAARILKFVVNTPQPPKKARK